MGKEAPERPPEYAETAPCAEGRHEDCSGWAFAPWNPSDKCWCECHKQEPSAAGDDYYPVEHPAKLPSSAYMVKRANESAAGGMDEP